MIHRRWLLAAPAILAVARCAPPPKPPAILTLSIKGGADQNPDASGKPSPVEIRIYQLAATGTFNKADVFALTEHEKETLGQDDLASEPIVITPGQSTTVKRELKAGTQAIGIVALFRDIDHAKWRADAPAASSGPTDLTLTIAKLSVSLAPSS